MENMLLTSIKNYVVDSGKNWRWIRSIRGKSTFKIEGL